MAKKKEKPLKTLKMKDVAFFKIANRKGYAAVCRNHLTEGSSVYQAYTRMVKAMKRSGWAVPERKAGQLKAKK